MRQEMNDLKIVQGFTKALRGRIELQKNNEALVEIIENLQTQINNSDARFKAFDARMRTLEFQQLQRRQ